MTNSDQLLLIIDHQHHKKNRIFTEVPEKDFEGYYMPRRALSPGMHAGLSVIMDVQEREYYCSATESVGFKVDAK